MKVAIYARISDEASGQTEENQTLQLTAHIKTQPSWSLTKTYVDHERGWNPNRNQLRNCINDAASHKFDLLLFWSLDRLSREGAFATLSYLKRLDDARVSWKSFTEPYLDTAGMFKDVLVAMLASLAKQETHRHSERVKAGIERKRGQGGQIGRTRKEFDYDGLKRLVESGSSVTDIGRLLKVSRSTVWRRVKEAGLELAGEEGVFTKSEFTKGEKLG
jgi:DNA invertase Pin-like site-specific DNA recombinase